MEKASIWGYIVVGVGGNGALPAEALHGGLLSVAVKGERLMIHKRVVPLVAHCRYAAAWLVAAPGACRRGCRKKGACRDALCPVYKRHLEVIIIIIFGET